MSPHRLLEKHILFKQFVIFWTRCWDKDSSFAKIKPRALMLLTDTEIKCRAFQNQNLVEVIAVATSLEHRERQEPRSKKLWSSLVWRWGALDRHLCAEAGEMRPTSPADSGSFSSIENQKQSFHVGWRKSRTLTCYGQYHLSGKMLEAKQDLGSVRVWLCRRDKDLIPASFSQELTKCSIKVPSKAFMRKLHPLSRDHHCGEIFWLQVHRRWESSAGYWARGRNGTGS